MYAENDVISISHFTRENQRRKRRIEGRSYRGFATSFHRQDQQLGDNKLHLIGSFDFTTENSNKYMIKTLPKFA